MVREVAAVLFAAGTGTKGPFQQVVVLSQATAKVAKERLVGVGVRRLGLAQAKRGETSLVLENLSGQAGRPASRPASARRTGCPPCRGGCLRHAPSGAIAGWRELQAVLQSPDRGHVVRTVDRPAAHDGR